MRIPRCLFILKRWFPWLKHAWYRANAMRDYRMPVRDSYSQHGEDFWIAQQLQDVDISQFTYVDVGANHPTMINNTYLFYRQGISGISVEPNMDLAALHRKYRGRDYVLNLGCSDTADLLVFKHAGASVLSGFVDDNVIPDSQNASGVYEFLPVFTVDHLVERVLRNEKPILLLSVDTEGHDAKVLAGATKTLDRTLFVCVETNTDEDRKQVEQMLGNRFELVRSQGCNSIFKNTNTQLQTSRPQSP